VDGRGHISGAGVQGMSAEGYSGPWGWYECYSLCDSFVQLLNTITLRLLLFSVACRIALSAVIEIRYCSQLTGMCIMCIAVLNKGLSKL
jgi:hypothetical protein